MKQSGFTLLETIVVVGVIGVVAVIAAPMVGNTLADFRVTGDVRGTSNAVALTKIRAASDFTRARLFVDRSTNAHHLEVFDKATAQWTAEGGNQHLSSGTSFGFGPVGTPPPSTQASIAQAAPCADNSGNLIANTSCFVFNSRGVPVDGTGNPGVVDAIYITNGTAVYAISVSATGMIRVWRTAPVATPTWVLQ